MLKSTVFAHKLHDAANQVRKFTGKPYWSHTDAVRETVESVTSNKVTIAAADVHDILEDIGRNARLAKSDPVLADAGSFENLVIQFGLETAFIVFELSNEFDKAKYPGLGRKERKLLETMRLSFVSPVAKLVKLADIISNTADIRESGADPMYVKMYLEEKQAMVGVIWQGVQSLDPNIYSATMINHLLEIAARQTGMEVVESVN